jgi:hypothetical protein
MRAVVHNLAVTTDIARQHSPGPRCLLFMLQGSNVTRSASGTALRSVSRPEVPGAVVPLPFGISGRTIATLSVRAETH